MGFPTLTPMYGLGSGARTGVAVNISGPRSRLGSQGRIYAFENAHGRGQQYKHYLIETLGLKYLPKVNPWTAI